MQKLLKGIRDFHDNVVKPNRDEFGKLAVGQAPDICILTCADSRVVPNLVVNAIPGYAFVIRNAGNIVAMESPSAELASIRYAIDNLPIRHLIIKGHSSCGAMTALVAGDEAPAPGNEITDWVLQVKEVRERVEAIEDLDTRIDAAIRINVLLQLQRLSTLPWVQEAMKGRKLRLHAWYYNVGDGEIHAWNRETMDFEVVGADTDGVFRLVTADDIDAFVKKHYGV